MSYSLTAVGDGNIFLYDSASSQKKAGVTKASVCAAEEPCPFSLYRLFNDVNSKTFGDKCLIICTILGCDRRGVAKDAAKFFSG